MQKKTRKASSTNDFMIAALDALVEKHDSMKKRGAAFFDAPELIGKLASARVSNGWSLRSASAKETEERRRRLQKLKESPSVIKSVDCRIDKSKGGKARMTLPESWIGLRVAVTISPLPEIIDPHRP